MTGGGSGIPTSDSAESEAKLAALEAKEAALEAREAELSAAKTQVEAQKHEQDNRVVQEPPRLPIQPSQPSQPNVSPQQMMMSPPQPTVFPDERRLVDEQLLAQFRSQFTNSRPGNDRIPSPKISEKIRLQKVYKLFKWTNQAVRKYGHDRLEIMLQTYKTMGYISKESAEEIREIARLMPANIGEEHEVGPDEFVSELYTLNRIIAPDDTTLDRDMIEVMMEQRIQVAPAAATPVSPRIEFPATPVKEKRSLKDKEFEEDWMNLPDRI
jgi:Tfp pilus assembly protein PilX